MKTPLERITSLAGLLVLTASLIFLCGIAGAALALPGALLIGVGGTLLWMRVDPETRPVWLPAILLSGAVLLSTLVLEIGFRADVGEWFAFPLTAAASGATVFFALRNRVRCNLCNRRLASQALTFRCPRCSQVCCEETCWNFEHRRCALCLEQRVHVLPTETAWWTRTTGPRATQGRCQVCLASAEQADLRSCPQCRRGQCRDCWDFRNGECGRCGAPLPDLPASLGTIVTGGMA